MHAAVLHYFRVVARSGSVRKASQELNVAASAVNRQIKLIEDELDVELFERIASGMRLTLAGQYLLQHINATLQDFELLRADIDGLREARSGHITIAAVDSLLVDFLPRVLEQFSQEFPAVTYSVDAVSPDDVPALVEDHKVDLGLTFVSERWPKIKIIVEIPAPIGVVMRPDHPLAGRDVVDFDDVGPYPKLAQAGTIPTAANIDPEFAHFRSTLAPKLVSNSIQMLKVALQANQGIAFFTPFGFLSELKAGELVWKPFRSACINKMKLGLLIAKNRKQSPSAQKFVEAISKQLLLTDF